MKRIPFLIILGFSLLICQPVHAQGDNQLALVLTIDGPITTVMQDYLARGIQVAEQRGAEVLILELNTPGGDSQSMFNMMQDIRTSRVPVVVYVSPRGAMAGSAGALITMAGHAAAMAPETAIGAASPISAEGEDLSETLRAKANEITKANLRPLVEQRGSEALQLAEAMIDEARAVSSNEALEVGLIDFIADDLDDLLDQMDGFQVTTAQGMLTLNTENAIAEELSMSFIEQLLMMLINPNVVFILLSIGVQAILIEISSPGGWVAGFIGAVCLALAAYGLGILPVNWFGILFLVIAFVLFIVDIKAPTHGALTVAGVGSFIVGALVLFNSPGTPQFQRVSLPLVILVGIITGAAFAVILGFALRAQRVPIRTGQESLVGLTGFAVTRIAPSGQIQAGSELWTAELTEGAKPIKKGDMIEVVKVEGLKLRVRKKE